MAKNNYTLIDDTEDEDGFGEDDTSGMTEEGEQMWREIARRELPERIAKIRKMPVNTAERELNQLRAQMLRMIENSENVIKECDEIIETYKTEKEYLAGTAKVAKTLHYRLIDRLTRILEGQEVFTTVSKVERNTAEESKPILLYNKPKR